MHNLGGARDVADPRTGVGRRATLRDQLLAARVMHNLVNQHQVTSLWQPEDVPDLLEPLYSSLILACETDKAIGGPGISHPFQAQYLKEMAQAVTGADGSNGVYPIDLAFSPVSPLVLGAEVTDAMTEQARRRHRRDPALPGCRHHGAGRAVGGCRAAERRGAVRRRSDARRPRSSLSAIPWACPATPSTLCADSWSAAPPRSGFTSTPTRGPCSGCRLTGDGR